MFMQFVFNASILLLCIFAYYFSRLRFKTIRSRQSRWGRLWTGAMFGLAGVIQIAVSLHIEGNVRIDLRGIPVMVAALIGGMPTALTASALVVLARLGIDGFHYSPFVGAATSIATAVGCSWLRSRFPSGKAFYLALGYSFIVNSISFGLVVKDPSTLYRIWIYYAVFTLPTAWISYQLVMNLVRVNELYERLEFSEEKYRQLFHSAHDMVYLTAISDGKPYRFLEVNETACRLLGYAREELLLLPPDDIHDQDYLHRLPEIAQAYKEKGQHTFEWSLKSKDGRLLPVEISGRIFQLQGDTVCLSVARDIEPRKEAERKMLEANRMLEKLSVSDGLTGISNRRGFDDYYPVMWNDAVWNDEPISVLMLDIDCFKLYNDTYGHLAGDQCLKDVAGVLDRLSARSDIMAARYGGEEFVVVLAGADKSEALRRAKAIRWSVEQLEVPHSASTVAPIVTVSIGAATFMKDELLSDPQDLIDAADRALYQAKRAGRNCVMLWEPDRTQESKDIASGIN